MSPLRALLLASAIVVVGNCACEPRNDDSEDATVDDSSDLGDGRLDGDDGGGAEDELDGGPMTFVLTDNAIVIDRICDIDGDGIEDSAVANLGEPDATFFAIALNTALAGSIEGGIRWIFHLPWVDDRATPEDEEVVVISYYGIDDEGENDLDRRDPADDFDGDEPYFCWIDQVDACGEPLTATTDVSLRAGVLEGHAPSLTMAVDQSSPMILRRVELTGNVERGGESMDLRLCGAATIRDLGEGPSFLASEGLTTLEVLLLGGAAFGLPTLPGLTADLDLDGDGLERFDLNVDGHIELCIDGDGTTMPGRNCWADDRMADGFSILAELTFVSALFAGLHPWWVDNATGTCDDPPEESIWDPR